MSKGKHLRKPDRSSRTTQPTPENAAHTDIPARQQPANSANVPRPASRVLFAGEIRERFFSGRVSEWWVRRNVAPAHKIRLGHSTVGWFEADVVQWINDRRGK
jgi:hypothetical protein